MSEADLKKLLELICVKLKVNEAEEKAGEKKKGKELFNISVGVRGERGVRDAKTIGGV